MFLQLKIEKFTKKDIISTYDKKLQDYYEAAINRKVVNYIVNYTLTKQANSYSRRSDSDTKEKERKKEESEYIRRLSDLSKPISKIFWYGRNGLYWIVCKYM